VTDLTPPHPWPHRAHLSPSRAALLLPPNCPAKFKQEMDHPSPSSAVQEFGSVVHTLQLGVGDEITVLEPSVHGLTAKGEVADNPRSTAMWKAAEAAARARGAIPVHADDYAKAREMVAAVRSHPTAGPLFADGHPEIDLAAVDPFTGVELRGRLDWMTMTADHVLIIDYKTAACADEHVFARKADDYFYPFQAAWYRTLAQWCGVDDEPDFLHVVQEKEPPFLVNVIELDREALERGHRQVRRAIDTYQHCLSSGQWPGYPPGVHTVSLPGWVYARENRDDVDIF